MKKRLTRGQKWLFASPLLLLLIVGALWRRPETAHPSLTIQGVNVIKTLGFSPDGRRLVVLFRNKQTGQLGGQIADSQSYEKICDLQPLSDTYDVKQDYFNRPLWSPDGKSVASLVWPSDVIMRQTKQPNQINNKRVVVWDTENGKVKTDIQYPSRNLSWRDGPLNFSSDSKTFAVEGIPPVIFEVATGKRVSPPDQSIDAKLVVKPNLKLGLWAISDDGKHRLQIVDAKNRRVVWHSELKVDYLFRWQGDVLCVVEAFPFGRLKPPLLLWDGKTRQELPTLPIPNNSVIWNVSSHSKSEKVALLYDSVTFDKKQVKSQKSGLLVWDFRTKRALWEIDRPDPIASLSWSPDGNRLVVIDQRYTASRLKMFDLKGKVQAELGYVSDINSWSRDSKQLAYIEFDIDKPTGITIARHVRIRRF